MRVLLVGSGAREHAIAVAVSKTAGTELFFTPGNPGMAKLGECWAHKVGDLTDIVGSATKVGIELAIIGPEVPLAAGIADRLAFANIRCFGPTAQAAQIEASKVWARDLMKHARVPQPEYRSVIRVRALSEAIHEIAGPGEKSVVVKASGLAAGKGVYLPDTLHGALECGQQLLSNSIGTAGDMVLIEERLEGVEISYQVLTDGERIIPLPSARDYKRAYDGDLGPNTGGMGAFAPTNTVTWELALEIDETIIRPVLAQLRKQGSPFRGCLYLGAMQTKQGPKVLEFNCRFGDPETQVILPLLDEELLPLLYAAATGQLPERPIKWSGCAVGLTLASEGYPGDYATDYPIYGIEEAENDGALIYHAGTKLEGSTHLTAGGRVLTVVSKKASYREAHQTVYRAAEKIYYTGKVNRADIADCVVG